MDGRVSSRIPWALALVAAAGTISMGASWATGLPRPDSPLPDTFALVGSRPGDAADYSLLRVERTPGSVRALSEERLAWQFMRLGAELGRTGAGDLRPIESFGVVEFGPTRAEPMLYFAFDSESREWVYSRMGGSWGGPGDAGALGGRRDHEGSRTSQYTRFVRDAHAPQELCGLRESLMPRVFDLRAPVAPISECRLFGWGAVHHAVFRPFGIHQAGDHRVLTLRAEALPLASGPADVYLQFAEDVPYPWAVYRADPAQPGAFEVVRLRSSAAVPPPPSPAPSPGPAPVALAADLEWAFRETWGPRDEDVDHAYPLSKAFAEARDNVRDSTLRDYLEQRPGAYTSRARFTESRSDTGDAPSVVRRWNYTLTDGRTRLHVESSQATHAGLVQLLAVDPPVVGGWLPGPGETHRYDLEEVGASDPDVPPDKAPRKMPTVSSVHARWRAYMDAKHAGEAPQAWEFRIECSGADCAPRLTLAGGVYVVQRLAKGDRDPPVDARWVALLEVDEEGRTVGFFTHQTQVPTVPGMPAPEGGELPNRVHEAGTLPSGPSWLLGASARVGLAGAAALLAALAYWAWTSFKGGAGVLSYNRLDRKRTLGHPVRAQLVHLIEREPGIHFRELARRLGLRQAVAQHHLGKLVDAEIVTRQAGSRYVCYFLRQSVDRALMRAWPALKSDGACRVLSSVSEHPGASLTRLAEVAGLDKATVSYHMRRLRALELVVATGDGRRPFLHATESGRRALAARVPAAPMVSP